MKPRIFLAGSRVYLRMLEPEDVSGNYLHWFDDEEVCRQNNHHRFPYAKASLIEYVEHLKDSRDRLVLAIISKEDNIHVGNISLQDIDPLQRSAEFAIVIGEKAYWRKGLASEAGSLVIRHGFNSLNLHRIYCGTSEKNLGMQKLARFLGFTEEGRRKEAFFKDGEYQDVIEYGIVESQWKQNQQAKKR
jgi:ribosomal-protein-alanine N-acetyltransferase